MQTPNLSETEKIRMAQAAYQRSLAIDPSWQTRQKLIDLLRKSGKAAQAERMQQALDAWRKQHPVPQP